MMNKLIINLLRCAGTSILILCGAVAFAQDSTKITLREAEDRFLKANLELLASRYSIESAKAQIIQARLFNNPVVYFEENVYNPISHRAFDFSSTSEQIVQINQLIYLAGKRNKRIKLEELNTQLTEYQFFDLLRTLKLSIRSTFFDIYYLQQAQARYADEVQSIRRTVSLYQGQYEKGNIPLKDLVRLKSFLFQLESDNKDLINQIFQKQSEFNALLTDSNKYYLPQVETSRIDQIGLVLPLEGLIDSAFINRADLKYSAKAVELERQNLTYQRALAVPDLTFGGVFDRAGNFVNNYFAVGISTDLPVFNRNQGNIKTAKAEIKRSEALYDQNKNVVRAEVTKAYNQALLNNELYKRFAPIFSQDFDRLLDGVLINYEKKNISLLEFVDFYEAYTKDLLSLYQLSTDRIKSFEEINYYTGSDIINY